MQDAGDESPVSRSQPGALHFRVLQPAGAPKEMKTMRYSGHPLRALHPRLPPFFVFLAPPLRAPLNSHLYYLSDSRAGGSFSSRRLYSHAPAGCAARAFSSEPRNALRICGYERRAGRFKRLYPPFQRRTFLISRCCRCC